MKHKCVADSPRSGREDRLIVGGAQALTQLGEPAVDLLSGIQTTGKAVPGAWSTESSKVATTHAFDTVEDAELAGFGSDQY